MGFLDKIAKRSGKIAKGIDNGIDNFVERSMVEKSGKLEHMVINHEAPPVDGAKLDALVLRYDEKTARKNGGFTLDAHFTGDVSEEGIRGKLEKLWATTVETTIGGGKGVVAHIPVEGREAGVRRLSVSRKPMSTNTLESAVAHLVEKGFIVPERQEGVVDALKYPLHRKIAEAFAR